MDKVEHYIDANGDEAWRLDGRLHREDGPAVYTNGSRLWYQHGRAHRDDGPAVIRADGGRVWYQHGKTHRIDGPAVMYADGDVMWYINDIRYSFDQYCAKLELGPEQIFELKLKYG